MALESFKVRRKDGELVPREGRTPTLGLAVVTLPLTYGQSLTYESFGKPVRSWKAEEQARLLSENLLSIEGEEIGTVLKSDIADVEAYTLHDILEVILLNSALDRLYTKSAEGGNEAALVVEGPASESVE